MLAKLKLRYKIPKHKVYKNLKEIFKVKTVNVLLTEEVLSNESLKLTSKLLFARILFLSSVSTRADKAVFYSNQQAVEELHISLSSVQRSFTELEVKKLITSQIQLINFKKVRSITVKGEYFTSSDIVNLTTKNVKMTTPKVSERTYRNSQNDIFYLIHNSIISNSRSKDSIYIVSKEFSQEDFTAYIEKIFLDYKDKYISKYPQLETMNCTLMADKFYNYYAPMNWKNKKGAPVKSLNSTVAQWCMRFAESPAPCRQPKTAAAASDADVDRIAQGIADTQFSDDENIIDVDLSTNDSNLLMRK